MITQLQQLCNAYGEASTFILKLVSRIRSIVSSHALGFGFGITTSKYPIIELSEVVEVLLLHRPNHLVSIEHISTNLMIVDPLNKGLSPKTL